MQKLPILAAIAASATVALAQNPRTPVKVDTATVAEFPDVASNGDLSAILYQDQGNEGIYVATSDGRGLTWSAPVRIDDKTGVTANFIDTRKTLKVSNGNIFACWRDERNSTEDDLYFTYSTDGGATWAANIEVDKGFVAGANPVREYDFAVDGDNGAILIATDNGDEELYLVVSTSLSTGALSAAIPATLLNGSGDADAIALAVEGDTVHFAFNHDVSGVNQTYYSAYDLISGTFLTQDLMVSGNAMLAGGDSASGCDIAVDGSNALIVFEVDDINGSNEELWANVVSGGVGFGDVQLGGYTLGTDDTDNADAMLNGDIAIVAWEDNRSGSDECYVASADISGGSLAFGADTLVSSGGGGYPAVNGGGDYVAVTPTAGGFPENAQGVVSSDGGLTFGANFDVAATVGDIDYTELAYNETYGNFIVSFLDDSNGSNECYAGGFRAQTASAVGTFSAGNTVSFEASGFGASEDGQFFALLASGSMGNLLAPDGRNLGLTQDTFYAFTRSRVPGQFAGALSGGMGSTSSFTLPSLPVGTAIYFVAIGYDASANLYSLTDVNSVTTL